MIDPKKALTDGIEVVRPIIEPHGFRFQFREQGKGSGGTFAWGEFIRENRSLQLHFRLTLGMIRYCVADQSASHGSYMQELGVWNRCRYPGFSEDPIAGFDDLAHDLAFAEDFSSGTAAILLRAASKEALRATDRNEQLMRISVGDVRKLEQMKDRFRAAEYSEVMTLATELKYPDKMSQSEQRMIHIARERTTGRLSTSRR